jgi:hypothetical protein
MGKSPKGGSMALIKDEFFAALTSSGMPKIPQQFSVVPLAQMIPSRTLGEIDDFIRLFDQVTTRIPWQKFVTKSAPEIARFERREVCFSPRGIFISLRTGDGT